MSKPKRTGAQKRRSSSGEGRSTFLDPSKIDEALAEVASEARGSTNVALAGGCALQLYGSPRFTQDIDLLVDGGIPGFQARGELAFGGICTVASNGVPIDLIERDDEYALLYADALASAGSIPGVPVRVVTLPYLAAMKLAAGRGKDEQDLEFILCDSGASWKTICAVIRKHLGLYAVKEIESLRSILAWKRKRES
jgi:hypothetical protein